MPQFELVSYLSQAFWMLVSFGFLYLLVDYVLFPMIEDVMDERKRVIAENLAAAEKANKGRRTGYESVSGLPVDGGTGSFRFDSKSLSGYESFNTSN